MIGSDNWLFYSMESDIDDYKGTNLFTEGQLAQIASQLTTSEQWLSNRGSEFVLMIAPNKETIYGEEHLPSYYKKGGRNADRSADRFSEEEYRYPYCISERGNAEI